MPDVAIVPGSPAGAGGPSRRASDLDLLIAALRTRGASAELTAWDDTRVAWDRFDAAVVCGDQGDDGSGGERLVSWAAATGRRTSVWNPPEVLRWNSHRSYLLELEDRGAPVMPTAWTARGDRIDLADLLTRRQWPAAVLRTAVRDPLHPPVVVRASADASVSGQDHLDAMLVEHDVLIQPHVGTIGTQGLLSVVVIDGRASHAVRSRQPAAAVTAAGRSPRKDVTDVTDVTHVPLDAETAALARWVVEATGAALLMARVDLVDDESGTPQVLELAATSPELHLRVAPDSSGTLADAILRRLPA